MLLAYEVALASSRPLRAKQFTQDIIDTLGRRVLEIVLPLPKSKSLSRRIDKETRTIVEQRADLRERAKDISFSVTGEKIIDSGKTN